MIKYKESRQCYECIKDDFKCSYSEKSYGKYAKKLAKKSEKTKVRYNNFIEIVDDKTSIIRTYSRTYGYKNIYVDTYNLNILSRFRWRVVKAGCTYYAITTYNDNGNRKTQYMHILLMGVRENKVIDHINGNGLCNKEKNLRHVTYTMNNKNKRHKLKNTIYENISIDKKSMHVYARITINKGKKKSKYFSINKYGYDNALILAKKWVDDNKNENNGYISKKIINVYKLKI